MGKILFALAAVLLVSGGLKAEEANKASGLYVTLVQDIYEYNDKNPVGIWEILKHTDDPELEFYLGDGECGRLGAQQSIPVILPLTDPVLHEQEFPQDEPITCVKLRFKYGFPGPVYLVEGGIGHTYVSLVAEIPPNVFFHNTLYTKVFLS